MTERKPLKREPKTKAELYQMLAEAVRNTQPNAKQPIKPKRNDPKALRRFAGGFAFADDQSG
jgi:hypothetical protein